MKNKLVLFPGNNLSPNKKWIEKIQKELKNPFPNSEIHYYNHWKTKKPLIDFDFELNALRKYSSEKNLMVFAKSVGVVLIIRAIKEKIISPAICIFLGVPISWSIKNKLNINKWIEGYDVNTLFIQNDNDPLTSYKELRDFLIEKKIRNYALHPLKGNTHDYNDFKSITSLIKKFIST